MNKPQKWYDVYPYGTKEGDEEAKVFRLLSRNPKYKYRSLKAIEKETGLSLERIEEIIDKYVNKIQPALIYANKSIEDHWCYWERDLSVLEAEYKNLSGKDKDNRIDKHLKATPDMIVTSDPTAVAI